MNYRETGNQAMDEVKQKVRNASRWLVWFGRFGYTAKGLIFILVGILAAYSAFTASKANSGATSAMKHIEDLPFGQVLLIIVAIGLVAHAVWRMLQAFMDTENKGSDTKGIVIRGIYAVISLIYFGLAFSAAKIVLDVQSEESNKQIWTAWLLAQTFGQWLVGAVGVIIIAVGCYQFYRAYTAKFKEKLLLDEMNETEEKWATYIGRIGFAARGVVFEIIAVFLLLAAYQSDSTATKGIGGALRELEKQPYGAWLLGFAAVGFVCYGLFMFVLAKYRRMVIK